MASNSATSRFVLVSLDKKAYHACTLHTFRISSCVYIIDSLLATVAIFATGHIHDRYLRFYIYI